MLILLKIFCINTENEKQIISFVFIF
jgi:hypothetical protein